ncbi:hypothetical protein Tco_1402088 [Tanacetum coccineum]
MTDAPQTNVQGTQVIEDTHVIIIAATPEVQHQSSSVSSGFISNMLNPNLDTGIVSILNLNTESTSLVDIPITTNVEMPPSSATTIPPPPIPLVQPPQQTPVTIPTIAPNTVTIKRSRDDQDEDEEPSTGSNWGSKRRRAGKEPKSTSALKEETSKSSGKSKEGSKSYHTNLARKEDTHDLFNELMDTPLDFSAFVMNRLKVDTLTPKLLVGPTFELMKGSCKSLVKLEYFLEEVCKGTTDKLDWNNPEGQQYPPDLRKPLPLIPNSQGRHVIPFDHFINNDLAYLKGGSSCQTYETSVTKTKAADYGYVKWIKDLVPNTMWSPIVEWHNYKHLDWITVRRNDDKLYTFKEGDYKRLCLQDIEGMLLLLVQGKLTNLPIEEA